MTTLTNSDRVTIINSKMKNLVYTKYNLDLDIIIENAKVTPSAASVSALNSSVAEIVAQIAVLQTELDKYPVEEA
jgi:ABC-type phosphate transport system auxiliary subunit